MAPQTFHIPVPAVDRTEKEEKKTTVKQIKQQNGGQEMSQK